MKQKVALVLSGGGARGMAHIGVIEALEEQGFEISAIAGTSMGALIGGIYALGKLDIYKDWLCTLNKLKVFELVDFTLSGQGLVKGDKLLHRMHELVGDGQIEDLNVAFAAVAADISNKREVVITKGSVVNAIRASIAIPTVFTPVKTVDGILVDGGVVNNLPIDHVKRTEGDILVAVNVNAPLPHIKIPVEHQEAVEKESVYKEKIREFYEHLFHIHPEVHEEKFGYFDVVNKTFSLMTYHSTQLALQKYSPDVLINISHECCGTFDFYKAEEMIETGRCEAEKSLREYNNQTT